jgi:hypothetical protein
LETRKTAENRAESASVSGSGALRGDDLARE